MFLLIAAAAPAALATAAPDAAAHLSGFPWLWHALLAPVVWVLQSAITQFTSVTHNLGWSLVALAVVVRAVFWPLNAMQYRSMAKMQALQPKMTALRAKHKDDPARLNTEVMALYKEHGTNPMAGCLPLVLQMPVLFSIYQLVQLNKTEFGTTPFLWIGSAAVKSLPNIFAPSLAAPDMVLLVVYAISMYFSIKLSSPPSSDPQQAQTQKIMAFASPLMIAFVGRSWPSALMLFWLTSNILQMAQQFLLRRASASTTVAASASGPAVVTIDVPRSATPAREAGSSPRRTRKGSRRSSR